MSMIFYFFLFLSSLILLHGPHLLLSDSILFLLQVTLLARIHWTISLYYWLVLVDFVHCWENPLLFHIENFHFLYYDLFSVFGLNIYLHHFKTQHTLPFASLLWDPKPYPIIIHENICIHLTHP